MYAKTLWKTDPPPKVANIIHSYTKVKVPNFFIYAKDKLINQVEESNNSTMNRIASKIPDPKLKFNKSISKFDYRMLMNLSCDFNLSEENNVIKSYDYWNVRQHQFNEQDENKKDQDLYKFKQIRKNIIDENKDKSVDYIVNTLVSYLYTVRKNSAKKTLWACFGDVILKNLNNNLEGKGQICPICGKRFKQGTKGQRAICCSEECSHEYKLKSMREKYNSET